MKRIGMIALFVFCLVLLGSEIFLRRKYGFCDAVLIEENLKYEYIAKPNQSRFRFGNQISYNSMSMRSPEIDKTARIIFGFGDSVLNGGTQTDDDSLASTILTTSLSRLYQEKIQFLNISAGSWGPDNCFAYLKEHIDFHGEAIYLFVSSHDAYDNMNFMKIVGVNPSFPSEQYKIAIWELLDRYLIPWFKKKTRISKHKVSYSDLGINKKKDGDKFNSGFLDLYQYSVANRIPLIIYLHAEKSELGNRSYNKQGQEIIMFAQQHDIPLIQDLGILDGNDYRDNIHINEMGQRKMADLVLNYIASKDN